MAQTPKGRIVIVHMHNKITCAIYSNGIIQTVPLQALQKNTRLGHMNTRKVGAQTSRRVTTKPYLSKAPRIACWKNFRPSPSWWQGVAQ